MDMNSTTILIVDDIPDIRELLSIILSDAGYEVLSASNGLEAIEILASNSIDLVVTDILMPKMDGIELINRAKESHKNLQFILISGGGRHMVDKVDYNYLDTVKKLTGVDTVFNKPFKPEELIQAVREKLKV